MTNKTRTPIEFIEYLLEVGDWFMSAIELEHNVDGEVLEEEAKEIVRLNRQVGGVTFNG